MQKALLFINGEPPRQLPDPNGFDLVACSDGAFAYLKTKNFPLEKIDFISGDFDSHSGEDAEVYQNKFIHTPDQDKTDFHKSLEIILKQGCSEVTVYGASGGEQDHFLGNLHTAYLFKDELKIVFFDEYSSYFFIPEHFTIDNVKGKMISLVPFPMAENVTTKGLNWSLNNENLSLTSRIGTRNFACEDKINISYEKGSLVLFVGINHQK
ncbi:MAG: thiamine diphosphokinase [Cloacibacterium sp.]|nr:thiamine diphosphokinase [Cloacibacterium sp.]